MNYTADRMSPATHSRAPSAAHPESNPLLTALRTRLGLAGPVERPISHRFSEDLEDLRWDALNGVEYDEEDSLTRIGEDELPDDYDLDQQRCVVLDRIDSIYCIDVLQSYLCAWPTG